LIATLSQQATAFTAPTTPTARSNTALHATSGRRAFMGAMFISTIMASPAFAEEGIVDDLAMPTVEEKKDEVGSINSVFVSFLESPETRQLQRRTV
jgi:hypothetical protein